MAGCGTSELIRENEDVIDLKEEPVEVSDYFSVSLKFGGTL